MLFPAMFFAQKGELRGTIWSGYSPVENVSVYNVSLKAQAMTDRAGKFSVGASVNDTIEISSMTFQPKLMVVKEIHLEYAVDISLEMRANEIEEITVRNYQLTGDLTADSKNIKVRVSPQLDLGVSSSDIQKLQFTADSQSKVRNEALPLGLQPDGGGFMGVNILEVAKLLFKSGPPKKNLDREKAYRGDVFESHVRKKYTDEMFTDTLKIHPDQIGLFLQYCSARQPSADILKPGKELELTDFLIQTAVAFNNEK